MIYFPLPLVIIAGLLIGVILNALADDLPRHRRLRLPHYPGGEPRPLVAWSGILAFLTHNRASTKGRRLSWRHPLTEIITPLLFVIATLAIGDDRLSSATRLLFWYVYLAAFVLIVIIDIEHRLILFSVIIPLSLFALVDAFFEPLGPSWSSALIGGAMGFGVFFLLYQGGFLFVYLSNRMRERKLNTVAFGYGDVMLMGAVGLILGWESLIFAMFFTVFLGAFGAIVWLLGRALVSRSYQWFTPLPYGPYIVIAAVIMLMFSTEVGAFFWSTSG